MAKKTIRNYEVDENTMEKKFLGEQSFEIEGKEERPDFLDKRFNTSTEQSPAEVETNGPETKNGIIANTSIVNARREPKFDSDSLEVLNKGDKVTILGRVGEFAKVSTNQNNVAYISSEFIEEV